MKTASFVLAVAVATLLVACQAGATTFRLQRHQRLQHIDELPARHRPHRHKRPGRHHRRHRVNGTHDEPFVHHLHHSEGSYFAYVELDGMTFPVDVDTGSSLFAVPSSGCVSCETDTECEHHTGKPCPGLHKLPLTDVMHMTCPPSSGSGITCPSSTTLTCGGITAPDCGCGDGKGNGITIQQCYGDGTGWHGDLVQSRFELEEGVIANVYAVAKTLNIKDGESVGSFTGIIGMAYKSLSGVPTVLDNLVEQTGIANKFTMCLCNDAGVLSIGASVYDAQYTDIIQESYYVVTMTDMLVDGTSLGVAAKIYNDGQCIVDSGTTDLVLPHSAFLAMYDRLNSSCATTNLVGICGQTFSGGLFGGYQFEMTQEDIMKFPTLSIVLDGAQLDIPQVQYLTTSEGYTSLAVEDSGDDVSGTILGDTLMRGYLVEFDRENKRVGFAPQAGCCSS